MLILINDYTIESLSCSISFNDNNNYLYIDIKYIENKEIQTFLSSINIINLFSINGQIIQNLQNSLIKHISFNPNQIILIVEPQEDNNEKS